MFKLSATMTVFFFGLYAGSAFAHVAGAAWNSNFAEIMKYLPAALFGSVILIGMLPKVCTSSKV